MAEQEPKSEYTAKDIYVLEGLEPVRKRPGMYIGSTGLDGLHHLVWEILDNSLDEAMAGHAKNIGIAMLPNNRVRVVDDGRGIPVDIHATTKKSALETVLTTLHAGGKFGGKAYQVSGGLHGVGASVVNALSVYMKATVCRDGQRYEQEYSRGKATTKVKKVGPCRERGTTVEFEADSQIFPVIKYESKRILSHIRQQAYLTSGTRITFLDQTDKSNLPYSFYFEGGTSSYVRYLTRAVKPHHENIFYAKGEKDGVLVEASFSYTEEFEIHEESFANNIHTPEGGTHLTGFRTALTRGLNDYAKQNNVFKGEDEGLTGDDVREGLTAVISVKIREPQFEGQTKAKLGNPEAKNAVETVVFEALKDFLERNPTDARLIIEKSLLASKARKAAKAARQTVLRKGILEGLALPGKLADCSSKEPEESELYIVEGESAGGCFSGDTKVALADGRSLTFEELIAEYDEGKKNYCYTMCDDGSIAIEMIENPRKTKVNAEVLKVILDNGEEIICTSDHKFMLRDGTYKQAKDLTQEDSLMPLYRQLSKLGKRITIKGYELVYQSKDNRWIFTHMLADEYNLRNGAYSVTDGAHRHHKDFNRLNNNPDNIKRMTSEEHLAYHRKMIKFSLHTETAKEAARQVHESEEYREKIRQIMTTPKMKKLLSKRAKKQWEDKEYKQYMIDKYLEFYRNNAEYRKKNNELLNQAQKLYWSKAENKVQQAEKTRRYFLGHPERKLELSTAAKKQWQDSELLAWRSQKTEEQWTDAFRLKRKIAYNNTYKDKALKLLKTIQEKYGISDRTIYTQERLRKNDKSLLKYETILQRFFSDNEEKLREAVLNYNHKIKQVIRLNQKIDVYDIEVPNTHNFALASGVFVHNSGKQARDRRFQAILPLRGKILNVERARLDKMLESKEIRALIIALGTAISQDFDISKLRYHRIIIMSDGDVDGAHIRTLLLTLFYRYFRPIVDAGYLYIAQPPLYKVQTGKTTEYVYSEEERNAKVESIKKESKGKVPSINLQRYKGLGEMNPEELWETTMNPANRVLLKVTVDDAATADKTFDILMGDEVLPRKKFIQTYAKSVKNLDI